MNSAFRVVFVQKFVPHYRLPFFERFRDRLLEHGIELVLIYGDPDPFEGSKVKTESPPWGIKVNSRILHVKGRYLYWQHAWRHVRRGDLVIVEHAAKLLDNYLLYAMSRLHYLKFGYFGHGENFLAGNELGISRWVKKAMLRNVARWFAYTEVSRQSLKNQGVDESLVTVVNNTLSAPDFDASGITKIPNRFVYIGGLYADKQIDTLLASAALIAAEESAFELHVVGDGPLRHMVEEAVRNHDWLHYHGSLYGEDRHRMLSQCEAVLIPGAVGLVAIDSFHFHCPIITTASHAHGPEIAYLEHEQNALINRENGDARSFADLVLRFIREPGLANRLQAACGASSELYTLDNMVERFCEGVLKVKTGPANGN